MSANDILDVLNIQRDESNQPPKKKQKSSSTPTLPDGKQLTGMARELYNLVGPNTPPINLNSNSYTANKEKMKKFKPSPWTRMPFTPKQGIELNHWVKGSKELIEQQEFEEDGTPKPYFFEKYNVQLEIPKFVDEDTYDLYMIEIKEYESKMKEERARREKERKEREKRDLEEKKKKQQQQQQKSQQNPQNQIKDDEKNQDTRNNTDKKDSEQKSEDKPTVEAKKETNEKKDDVVLKDNTNETKPVTETTKSETETTEQNNSEKTNENETNKTNDKDGEGNLTKSKDSATEDQSNNKKENDQDTELEWTYKETKHLFELCQAFELKWPIIHDRFPNPNRTAEDLKEQFYRICIKILENQENKNQALIDSLKAYCKPRELERKQYLENLLKRTPAEIAEEESLVIEARRFEIAAKKMLMERSNLLTLLDSPQTTQNVSQYQSSQGITNLYNNLLIYDKHQKKKQMANKSNPQQEPVPPPIPLAASSSVKRDRGFQTQLQQYLSSFLKQNHHTNPAVKQEINSIQQLLMKRLTQKEEEAYGLYFHGTEKLNPGVMLRSQQKLPGLNQRQSILKSVNILLQEMDIPTGSGTSWKPIMPTRKTMAKYDELIRSVVTLLDVKKAKDKLESEIKLIKSQRGL